MIMSDNDQNPFSNPFGDAAATTAVSSSSQQTDLNDYNPFANENQPKSQPPVGSPTGNPPVYTSSPVASAKPVATPQQQAIVGREELLKRQEELERKAEELAKKEQQLNSGNLNPRANNWPPIPRWCPIGPCFYQDFAMDIPIHSQRTIKLLYYYWLFYVLLMFLNLVVCLAVFAVKNSEGKTFGLSFLWFCVNSPCSMCWYRPVYNAFRSDSSFWFFYFFFIMFFQVIASGVQAVGINGFGYAGWILALSAWGYNKPVGAMAMIMAGLLTLSVIAELLLLIKVHRIYRMSGASFEKAQHEFASGVVTNPTVQQAAANAATSAVRNRN